MTDTTGEDMETVFLVFMRACTLTGSVKGCALLQCEAGDSLSGKTIYLPRKMFPKAIPGAVYEIAMKDDTYRPSSLRFKHFLKDIPIGWVVEHEAALGEERAEAYFKAAKGKAVEAALRDLEPLKLAYKKTDQWGRTIIEARVLQWLRSPL